MPGVPRSVLSRSPGSLGSRISTEPLTQMSSSVWPVAMARSTCASWPRKMISPSSPSTASVASRSTSVSSGLEAGSDSACSWLSLSAASVSGLKKSVAALSKAFAATCCARCWSTASHSAVDRICDSPGSVPCTSARELARRVRLKTLLMMSPFKGLTGYCPMRQPGTACCTAYSVGGCHLQGPAESADPG